MIQSIQTTLDTLLKDHAEHLDTRAILIDHDAISRAPEVLKAHFDTTSPWLLVVDENTWNVAGEKLSQELDKQDISWSKFALSDHPDHPHPVCDDNTIAQLKDHLTSHTFGAVIAVGSGTINDVVKKATSLIDTPCACVATAPSMNGFTSKIAAVLSKGVKTTIPAQAPLVVIADLDVMMESPERMIASGLGDLISKPVSNADWQLSALLNDTFHSEEAMVVIELGAKMLDNVAPTLQHKDPNAMAGLLGSLMVSGLAMSIAGSSSPASGGEHLISHYMDMTGYAHLLPFDFHGCQVGVGTLTTALFYEKLFAMDPASIDIDAAKARLASWDEHDALLKERFGVLHHAVREHAINAYPSEEDIERRLGRLQQNWDEVKTKVSRTLRTSDSIEQELRAAHGPVRFSDLGLTRERATEAVVYSKDIRNRYTILHLAWELGLLDQWAEEALEKLF